MSHWELPGPLSGFSLHAATYTRVADCCRAACATCATWHATRIDWVQSVHVEFPGACAGLPLDYLLSWYHASSWRELYVSFHLRRSRAMAWWSQYSTSHEVPPTPLGNRHGPPLPLAAWGPAPAHVKSVAAAICERYGQIPYLLERRLVCCESEPWPLQPGSGPPPNRASDACLERILVCGSTPWAGVAHEIRSFTRNPNAHFPRRLEMDALWSHSLSDKLDATTELLLELGLNGPEENHMRVGMLCGLYDPWDYLASIGVHRDAGVIGPSSPSSITGPDGVQMLRTELDRAVMPLLLTTTCMWASSPKPRATLAHDSLRGAFQQFSLHNCVRSAIEPGANKQTLEDPGLVDLEDSYLHPLTAHRASELFARLHHASAERVPQSFPNSQEAPRREPPSLSKPAHITRLVESLEETERTVQGCLASRWEAHYASLPADRKRGLGDMHAEVDRHVSAYHSQTQMVLSELKQAFAAVYEADGGADVTTDPPPEVEPEVWSALGILNPYWAATRTQCVEANFLFNPVLCADARILVESETKQLHQQDYACGKALREQREIRSGNAKANERIAESSSECSSDESITMCGEGLLLGDY